MADANPMTDVIAQAFLANPPETVDDMRRGIDMFGGMLNADLPEIGAFHEGVVLRQEAGHTLTADVHVPRGDGPHPVLVYLHGGGWICGSPTTHRKLGHRFAEQGLLVVNVDYRLAPEHPFPAPFEDCLFAVEWAQREATAWGGDAARLAVGGDSAGGNLAAAVASALADAPGGSPLSAALLIYGVFDFARIGEGMDEVAAAGPLADMGEKMVEMMVGSYLGSEGREAKLADARVSPLHAASKLPPSYVVCGEADPLVAQAEALAGALAAAGVTHEHETIPQMPHGFIQMEFLPPARATIDAMVKFLAAHL